MATALPRALGVISLSDAQTPAAIRATESTFVRQHGKHVPKGTTLPETLTLACPRVRVADLPAGHLKQNHIQGLEQNQKIASCCRHPEGHEVEAFKTHPDEEVPSIYIFHCTCGRKHRFFCVGMTDPHRPTWQAG